MTENALDLDELDRLIAATTGTPWEWSQQKADPGELPYVPEGSTLGSTLISLQDTYEESREDCAYLAAMATHGPALVAQVRRLTSIISGARYCLDAGTETGARACLEGKGLEDGIAEDVQSDLDWARAENAALRSIISQTATALGATISPSCTAEFMAGLPEEARLVVERLKGRAEAAEAQQKQDRWTQDNIIAGVNARRMEHEARADALAAQHATACADIDRLVAEVGIAEAARVQLTARAIDLLMTLDGLHHGECVCPRCMLALDVAEDDASLAAKVKARHRAEWEAELLAVAEAVRSATRHAGVVSVEPDGVARVKFSIVDLDAIIRALASEPRS